MNKVTLYKCIETEIKHHYIFVIDGEIYLTSYPY